MSEETDVPQFGEGDAPPKPVRLQPNTEAAVIEVLTRERARLKPCYSSVALRHGIKPKTLKNAMTKYRQGLVTLQAPTDAEEMEIDARGEMDKTLRLLRELERMLNDSLRGLIERARPLMAKGKLLAYRDLGIPLVIQDLRAVKAVRRVTEEGFMAILEAANREKRAKAAVADVPSETVDTLTTAQRAARALQRAQAAAGAVPAEVTG